VEDNNMATYTLQLSEKVDKQLQKLAARQGRDAAGVALEIVEKWLAATVPAQNPNDLPYEVWHERFTAMLKDLPRVDVVVDDSRESIYEGRGE
jgi:hypothetical protein